MTDRPILFSAPMVRALLAGTKTQTRRTLRRARVFATPETKPFTLTGAELERALQGADRFRHLGQDGWFWEADAFEWQAPSTRTGWMAHIGYAPGDRLWVKETFSLGTKAYPTMLYRADRCPVGLTWKPSIFMRRQHSRITLTVTDVRIERLQDISEADAIAEGVEHITTTSSGNFYRNFQNPQCPLMAYGAYRSLWEHINGAGAWEANPWVVTVSFDVREGNIDA